jgi:hypothetical protein
MKIASLVRAAGPIVGGALAGFVVVVFAGAPPRASAGSPAETRAPAANLPRTTHVASDDRAPDPRVAVLEKQVEELSSAVSAVSAGPRAPSPLEEDRDARTRRMFDDHEKLLAQHDAERRDAAWAPKQQRVVEATLGALSGAPRVSFSLRSVDCRTSSCVARLAWPSENAARMNLQELLAGSAAAGCAREIAFPHAETEGSYVASLYFDCAEARWGGQAH